MKSIRKMLLAGGSYADIPMILAAKQLGFYVITSGNRSVDLGHKYSDEYAPADFADPEAILAVAKKFQVEAICPSCNDFSALSSAYAAEQLGLPGHDPYSVAEVIHHKDRYRAFATAHCIATPLAIGFENRDDALSGIAALPFPVIVKPVDLTGGKGVSVIHGPGEASAAIDKAFAISKKKRIVIEEFIVGTRHGFSSFLVDGKVVFYFSDNEHYFLNPYLVSAASCPSIVPPAAERQLCADAEKIAALLELKTGIFHIQYILRGTKPVIIEICRRPPGDLYVKLVEHATGIDYPSWIVRAAAGRDCSGLKHVEPHGFFTRHCVMSAAPGKVKEIIFDPSIAENIIDRFMWGSSGDEVTDVLSWKCGIIFFRFTSVGEMLVKTEQMQKLVQVIVD